MIKFKTILKYCVDMETQGQTTKKYLIPKRRGISYFDNNVTLISYNFFLYILVHCQFKEKFFSIFTHLKLSTEEIIQAYG